MKMNMKKEKIRKRKEEPPKVLVQTPSIYSVRVDLKAPQTKEFPKKIMEKLVPYYPLYKNQTPILEFELKDFESGIVETFNVPKEHKYYGIYEHMYFSRSLEEIIKDRLLALSNYVGGFLRSLGFEVPAQDLEIDSGKIMVRIKVKRLGKINNALNKFIEKMREKKKQETEIFPTKISIKNVRLDEDNYLLEINNGEKIISFKSKKKIKKYYDLENQLTKEQEEELKREAFKTKQFKILTELWRFRWEKVSGKVRKVTGVESDYTTLQNLTQYSKCKSNEATRKHIYRLNKIFKDEGVPIEIEIKNDKAIRLIIDKS